MLKGSHEAKRPADSINAGVMIAEISTDEIDTNQKYGRVRSGKAGAESCIKSTILQERSDIAKIAAKKRWKR